MADKLGGYRSIASGAIFGDMDVDVSSEEGDATGWKIDCKLTDKKSRSVNIEKFQKIREAAVLGQIPAYIIEYRQHEERLFVIDEKSMFYFLQTIDDREETIEDLTERVKRKWYVYRTMDNTLKELEGENERLKRGVEELDHLRSDLADWWEMSRGGKLDEDMEHLSYLMDEHNIEKRVP